jgi:hypothetical protein
MMDEIRNTSKAKILSELNSLQLRLSVQEQQILASMLLFGIRDNLNNEVEAHFMLPPSLNNYDYARRRSDELLREAEQIRMADEAEQGKLPFWTKLIDGVGSFMIALGSKLAYHRRVESRQPHLGVR